MPHLSTLVQVCFAALFSISSAHAHEFWIDPVDASVAVGDPIEADLRVGEQMKGSGLIYNPKSFTYFATFTPDGKTDAEGRLGDRPALQAKAEVEGLHVIAHMTTANRLKYAEFQKFETFAKTHGQAFAIEDHKARGLPEEDFTEAYFRCAKALVKVGHGEGADRAVGFPFELTALDNPYTSDGDVRFVLTYKGVPKGNHQVDVFRKISGEAEAEMVSLMTDDAGEVTIPRQGGDFLINAVVLEAPSSGLAEKLGAVWVSLWASTTYSIE